MDVFPAFFPLKGRKVFIFGMGAMAKAKRRLFEKSGADIVWVTEAAVFITDPMAMPRHSFVFIAPSELADCETECELIVKLLIDHARRFDALINIVDKPDQSDFFMPAVIDRQAVVGAVSTGGQAPILAVKLRQEIEALWPSRLGHLAHFIGQYKDALRSRCPDPKLRRRLLYEILETDLAEAVFTGDMQKAERLFKDFLNDTQPSKNLETKGWCWSVRAKDPDHLTLADLKHMARADKIALFGEVSDSILTFVRRDAEQNVSPDSETLNQWISEGFRICQIFSGKSDHGVL